MQNLTNMITQRNLPAAVKTGEAAPATVAAGTTAYKIFKIREKTA